MRIKKFENFEPRIQNNNLIKQRMKFIPLIKGSSLEAEELAVVHQSDKWTAMSFIERGNPSEWYLEQILQLLKDNGVDTSSITEITTESVNEEFGKDEIIFTGKRNPRLTIVVKISPDRRISEIENKTGIRFPFVVGQPLNRNIEVWACNNNFLMDGQDTCPEKKVFGVRASDVPKGHEWRHIFPNKFK
jgi:hypothetical protein